MQCNLISSEWNKTKRISLFDQAIEEAFKFNKELEEVRKTNRIKFLSDSIYEAKSRYLSRQWSYRQKMKFEDVTRWNRRRFKRLLKENENADSNSTKTIEVHKESGEQDNSTVILNMIENSKIEEKSQNTTYEFKENKKSSPKNDFSKQNKSKITKNNKDNKENWKSNKEKNSKPKFVCLYCRKEVSKFTKFGKSKIWRSWARRSSWEEDRFKEIWNISENDVTVGNWDVCLRNEITIYNKESCFYWYWENHSLIPFENKNSYIYEYLHLDFTIPPKRTKILKQSNSSKDNEHKS